MDEYEHILDYEDDDENEAVLLQSSSSSSKQNLKPLSNKDNGPELKRKQAQINETLDSNTKRAKTVAVLSLFSPISKKNGKAACSSTILLSQVPNTVLSKSKIQQHMARFGEILSVVLHPKDKAIVKYLTSSGADRAFISSAPIFNNSAIQVHRIPDHDEGHRDDAIRNGIRAPNRAYINNVNTFDASPIVPKDIRGNSALAKRTWSRSSAQTGASGVLLSPTEQKEMSKARLREQMAWKQHALAKKKLMIVGQELTAQKQKLNQLSLSRNVTPKQKQEIMTQITSLMMQMKHADATVKTANKAVEAAAKGMDIWRKRFEGKPVEKAGESGKAETKSGSAGGIANAKPTQKELLTLQSQLQKLKGQKAAKT